MRVPEDPSYWYDMAQEHGRCLADFMRAGLDPDLCYEQALVAFYFGRKFQTWSDVAESALTALEAKIEDERDGVACDERAERQGRFARDIGDMHCAKCEDKYTAEGRERGVPVDMSDVIGE